MEEKRIYKLEIMFLKVIPMLLALTALLNTIFSYFDIDTVFLSYIGGVSILPFTFLYLSSYVFRFCGWHRLFLHYVLVNWILNIIDYYIGIPVSDKSLFILYIAITGIFLFLLLYMRQKSKGKC